MDDFIALKPDSGDIVYISNHGIAHQNNEHATLNALHLLSSFNCVYILWFFHDYINNSKIPKFNRWILTGEHFRREPVTEPHNRFWKLQNTIFNYVPLTFATNIPAESIGKITRQEDYSSSFIGAHYQQEWCRKLLIDRKDVIIRYTPPFIDEQTRVSIFRSSVVSLGFHSDNNAANSVIVERVFEGLALGNVVISDNPACEDATDGNVTYVSDYQQVKNEIEKWWNDKEARKLRQERGMQWCKEFGTYKAVSKAFIEMSKKV
jgi:hypothetical protein